MPVQTNWTHKVHTGLFAKGPTHTRRVCARLKYLGSIRSAWALFAFAGGRFTAHGVITLTGIGVAFFLSLDSRQFKELDACSTNGVRPVVGSLCCCDATSNLVEEVRGRDRSIERGYQVGGECIKCLYHKIWI